MLISLMGLLVCCGSGTLFFNFSNRSKSNFSGLGYVGSLYMRLQGAMRLGSLPALSKLGMGLNVSALLGQQLALMSGLNQQIYALNQQAFS